MMQRILIIGSPGAGKSTLARQLGERLDLPLTHLDQLFWSPGWVQVSRDDFLHRLSQALEEERWIMDGNYASSLPQRLARAELVIYLDFPTSLCFWRVMRRTVRSHGRTRPDMAADCPERFDPEFFRYVLKFRRHERPSVEQALQQKIKATVMRATSPRELNAWLQINLPAKP